jgi:tripartite-type tricarboxylate transporter receptor subunit TctC
VITFPAVLAAPFAASQKSAVAHAQLANPLITALAVLCAALTMMPANAEYPERPITLIVPSAAGGSPETTVRLLAAQLTQQIGQQIVIDSRPGGVYTIGTMMIVRAVPDGYTMGYGNVTSLAINRTLLTTQPYDVDKDLQPVVQVHYQSNVLAVTLALAVLTVKELIEFAKNHPGQLLYGSAGNGTSGHLSAELFKFMTDTQIVHVPYKGSPQAIIDLIGGQVQLTFNNLVVIAPHIKAGKVRGLGVTGPKRSTFLPDLPTIAEAGVPGYEVTAWGGVIAPAGVPKPIISKINAEINKAFAVPSVRKQFAALGSEPVGGTPEQFAEFIKTESQKWASVIKRSGAKID